MTRMLPSLAVIASLLASTHAKPFSFISIGDFGGAMLDPLPSEVSSAAQNVAAVASSMNTVASTLDPKFVVNTGDAFYYCGITNTTDDQIKGDWIDPFMSKPAVGALTWHGILGNHAYGYNPQALIDMTAVYDKWDMPARYYSKRVALDSTNFMTMIYLDTNPCLSDYRSTEPTYWDPCGGNYPTCSGGPMRAGGCKFHPNIMAQSCTAQETWLKSTLAAVPADDWLVVVGHHPAFEVDEFDLVGLLQHYPVALYINGHSHELASYTMDSKGVYITTGAGSLSPISANTTAPLRESNMAPVSSITASGAPTKHWYNFVFSEDIAGFTSHVFTHDFSSLKTNFHDTKGNILKVINVKKP